MFGEPELAQLIIICIGAVFFFSSRRRHTRWPRDWSSDVCSSDLVGGLPGQDPFDSPAVLIAGEVGAEQSQATFRSEERRVGKECRYRCGTQHKKEKRKEERREDDIPNK